MITMKQLIYRIRIGLCILLAVMLIEGIITAPGPYKGISGEEMIAILEADQRHFEDICKELNVEIE